jgi:hypothetical protein
VFEHLWAILPQDLGMVALVLATLGIFVGVGLWLAGARFSRSILTLTAVALGTSVGMRLPQWCGWSIDGMGPGVGAAVVLGLSAYVLHRLWVGLCLGSIVAIWATLVMWAILDHGVQWNWPAFGAGTTLPLYLQTAWRSLPPEMQRYLPLIVGGSIAGGMATTILWPRVGLVVLWSTVGVSLLLAMGAMTMYRQVPEVLEHLPRQTGSQVVVLCGLIAVGAVWQWATLTDQEGKDAKKPAKKESAA